MQQLHGTAVKRLNRSWRRRASTRLALMLNDVQSPFNVGAIVRAGAALGVTHLYLVGRCASPSDPKAQKLAMGTDRYLQVRAIGSVAAAMDGARTEGYAVVGLELADSAHPLHELDLSGDTCIAVGHENRGLGAEFLGRCDAVGYIPQLGKVGSLNVAAALTVAAYEVRRQEWSGTPD